MSKFSCLQEPEPPDAFDGNCADTHPPTPATHRLLHAAAVTSFLTLFVGASGPLVAAFIKQVHVCKFTTIATFAVAMTSQHLLKISVFYQIGFPLLDWLPLLMCMILSGAIGTFVGLRVLKYMSDKSFHRTFNLILTALAFRMIWQAWQAL